MKTGHLTRGVLTDFKGKVKYKKVYRGKCLIKPTDSEESFVPYEKSPNSPMGFKYHNHSILGKCLFLYIWKFV